MLRAYYALTKPGIIYGNLVTTAAGFFLASKGVMNIGLFVAIMAGTSLVIASACVFNNYIDRDIDVVMERTKQRALVAGTISGARALIFGSALGLLGGLVLIRYTNWLFSMAWPNGAPFTARSWEVSPVLLRSLRVIPL